MPRMTCGEYISFIRIPEGERRKNGAEATFEDMNNKIFPNMTHDTICN